MGGGTRRCVGNCVNGFDWLVVNENNNVGQDVISKMHNRWWGIIQLIYNTTPKSMTNE